MSAESSAEQVRKLNTPVPTAPAKLLLDAKNPRIIDAVGEDASQSVILKHLWDEAALRELVLSIAHNGFLPHEPLFAEPSNAKLVVIEGNRRLAAVKILLEDDLRRLVRANDIPQVSDQARASLSGLPVVVTSRLESWQYIGFKHVNGPKQWDSVAKARYIVQIKREFGIPLKEIAETIGDTNETVERLYRGMVVLTQAEERNLFRTSDSHTGKLAFSHLYTGMGYSNTQKYLGIDSRTPPEDLSIPQTHDNQLKNYLDWLYGSKSERREAIVKTQNPDLRALDVVLGNDQAVETLTATKSLKRAQQVALGASKVFRENMLSAQGFLQEAYGIAGTGFEPDSFTLKVAEDVLRLATNIKTLIDQETQVQTKRGNAK